MEADARLFCTIVGLAFLAVSGDGWLDTEEQRDVSPDFWQPCLQALKRAGA